MKWGGTIPKSKMEKDSGETTKKLGGQSVIPKSKKKKNEQDQTPNNS